MKRRRVPFDRPDRHAGRLYTLRVLSLVLPTFNEAENLPTLLPEVEKILKSLPHEIIVVDDNSPDKTWKVAQQIAIQYPHVRVLRRVGRRGLSSAVIEGFLTAKGDVLAVMDADGQHDMSLLPKLAAAITDGAGIALGSRYTEGGSVGEWDERRAMLSRIATRMAIRLCRVQVTDPMSGFFAVSRETFEDALPRLNPKGFKILLDLLVHVSPQTTVKELPFSFGARTKGESKLSSRVQLEFIEYLYDSTVGRWLSLTFVKYAIVGTIGVFINVGTYLMTSRALFHGTTVDVLGFSLPLLAGIEAAILFNFLLNNSWTFSYAKLRGWAALRGFIVFNVACLFGALANYAVTSYLFVQGTHELAAVAMGAFVGMIWNYTMSRAFTWKV